MEPLERGKANHVGARGSGARPGVNPVHPIPSGGAIPRHPRGPVRLKDGDIGRPSAGRAVTTYPSFHAAVAHAQLTSWLPGGRRFLLDISGPSAHAAEVAASAGHSVLRVIGPETTAADAGERGGEAGERVNGTSDPVNGVRAGAAGGRLSTVTADGTGLEFLPDSCAD